jgi:L-fucose mutarotase
MLKNIDPLLTPDLLKVLAEMGHDDAIVLADANFTAMSLGAGKPVLRLPGIGMARAVQAVASVLPLAQDVPHPVAYMQVGGTEVPYRSALQRETWTCWRARAWPASRLRAWSVLRSTSASKKPMPSW